MPNPEGINQYSGGGAGGEQKAEKSGAGNAHPMHDAHERAAARAANEHHAEVNRLHAEGRHVEANALDRGQSYGSRTSSHGGITGKNKPGFHKGGGPD